MAWIRIRTRFLKASIQKRAKSISDLDFARKIALDLLSVRARSEAEVREKLTKKNVPDEIIDELCERFTEVGLLDDAKFAAAFVESRSQFSGQGRTRIRMELRKKGVPDDIIAEALEEVSVEDELTSARAIAEKKARTLAGLERHVAQRRLAGVLARRGFSPSVVMQCVQEVLDEWNG